MGQRISTEQKEAALKRLLPPHNESVKVVSEQTGIGEASLYKWRLELQRQGAVVPGAVTTSAQWSAEARFAAVVETATLSEIELSEYCRQKGLYPDQVKEWKQACIQGQTTTAAQRKQLQDELRADRLKIKQLEKELNRKDKALAETTALLVLRKKLNALYGEA